MPATIKEIILKN